MKEVRTKRNKEQGTRIREREEEEGRRKKKYTGQRR